MNDGRRIYLDHAATSPLKSEVLDVMMPYLTENFGNPSAEFYKEGRDAKIAVETAREHVAQAIGASVKEIYFTASGTESDNWAICGFARLNKHKGNHIITCSIEHHAVLHPCQQLEKEGFSVTYLKPDKFGRVSPNDIAAAINEQTILISIMFANNEIGTIQPIAEIGAIARARNIAFHTDAVQAIDTIPIDVDKLGVDTLSLSAHKFGGPKGVGALYIRSGTNAGSIMFGGAQERGRRAGTENVAGIVGLGAAIEIAAENAATKADKLKILRDKLIDRVLAEIPEVILNGHPTERLAGNTNFCFRYIEGEGLLLMLDMKGIAASSGSACTSGSLDPSHVLLGIGLEHEIAHGSLRLSLGEETTPQDIDYTVEVLKETVERLRLMSPLYNKGEI
ncbi:MAG: cysteine desulfurase NifS [Oscillospiraceae bacterium]|nr:cysteine desulfurase NifS [Oscillospiraceae bacterium]